MLWAMQELDKYFKARVVLDVFAEEDPQADTAPRLSATVAQQITRFRLLYIREHRTEELPSMARH
jgi:hypothetical protein